MATLRTVWGGERQHAESNSQNVLESSWEACCVRSSGSLKKNEDWDPGERGQGG